LTVYPAAIDNTHGGVEPGGSGARLRSGTRDGVVVAIVDGSEPGALEVVRGGEARAQMIALTRDDPAAVDESFSQLKRSLEEAVGNRSAL
jgi:uncharacterized oxidoreductase